MADWEGGDDTEKSAGKGYGNERESRGDGGSYNGGGSRGNRNYSDRSYVQHDDRSGNSYGDRQRSYGGDRQGYGGDRQGYGGDRQRNYGGDRQGYGGDRQSYGQRSFGGDRREGGGFGGDRRGGGGGGGSNRYNSNDFSETMEVRQEHIGRIIGRGGSNVQRVERDYRVRVNIDKGSGTVNVSGQAQGDVSEAISFLKTQVEECSENNGRDGGYGRRD